MLPALPGLLLLAQRLTDLREKCCLDVRITQAVLAGALGQEQLSLSSATVSSCESVKSPKLPPAARLTAYARFFATGRSVESTPPRLLPLDEFTPDERDAFGALQAELEALRDGAKKPLAEPAVQRSWVFADQGPLTLVCAHPPKLEKGSLADPAAPNYTEFLSHADLNAMVGLDGHVRTENPSMGVFFKLSSDVVPDDLSGRVVLIGGIAWNEMTGRLFAMTDIPIRQIEDPEITTGEIFVLEGNKRNPVLLPKWEKISNLIQDFGLLARTQNPLNFKSSLTICNGVHSRGVLGAVRALTDARLRDSNERYIAKHFAEPTNFAILMRVSVIAGQDMTRTSTRPIAFCTSGRELQAGSLRPPAAQGGRRVPSLTGHSAVLDPSPVAGAHQLPARPGRAGRHHRPGLAAGRQPRSRRDAGPGTELPARRPVQPPDRQRRGERSAGRQELRPRHRRRRATRLLSPGRRVRNLEAAGAGLPAAQSQRRLERQAQYRRPAGAQARLAANFLPRRRHTRSERVRH
jgi:hypothetical protein